MATPKVFLSGYWLAVVSICLSAVMPDACSQEEVTGKEGGSALQASGAEQAPDALPAAGAPQAENVVPTATPLAPSVSQDDSSGANDSPSAAPAQRESTPFFQLGTIRNEIWSPVKPASVLRGYAEKTEPPPAPRLLRGGVTYIDGGSALNTIQRMTRAQFLANFIKLTPQLDTDIFRQLKAQLSLTKPKLDALIQKGRAELEAQLAKGQPKLPANIDLFALKAAREVPAFDSQLKKADPRSDEIARDKRLMDEQLSRPKQQFVFPDRARMGQFGPDLSQMMAFELSRARPLTPPSLQVDGKRLQADSKELQAELARRRPQFAADLSTDIQWKIDQAKKASEAKIAQARPELEAVYTRLRQDPSLATRAQLGSTPVEARAAMERLISWDQWYAGVARTYEPRLLKALRKFGSPSGANTVSISVWPDRHLQVSLASKSNRSFDAAVIEAYNSLDGDPCLNFPAGSLRQKVTFLIDNSHKSAKPVSEVTSETCKGDREIQVMGGN
jgi:hypothetical protein